MLYAVADRMTVMSSARCKTKPADVPAARHALVKVDLAAGKARQQCEIEVTDLGVLHGELVEDAVVRFDGRRPNYLHVTRADSKAQQGLLTAHGAHHVQQIQQFQAKQYEQKAKTWAAMTSHMCVIADALVGGIAKQFPDKFR